MRKPKVGKKKNRSGLWVTLVTLAFVAIGATCMVIGFLDSILSWLTTTGIAILVVGMIPLCVFGYNVLQKKIDS